MDFRQRRRQRERVITTGATVLAFREDLQAAATALRALADDLEKEL